MTINGISGANTQAAQIGMNQAMDSYSKNIQNQIANAQKQLQELSSNEEMTLEEKMKKRQEIQQQISDLNMQLRQHQIEQRKEQQSKGASMDDMLGGNRTAAKSGNKGSGLSQASMQAMISADSSMKLATQMQGRANVLKAEIKQSGSTEAKEAELADLEQKAVNATASQMNTLAEANKAVSEAAAAERTEKKTSDAKEEKEAQAEGKTEKTENVQQDNGAQAQNIQPAQTAVPETPAAQPAVYTHVDVRL